MSYDDDVIHFDASGRIIGSYQDSRYDWVDRRGKKTTPEENPYAFSPYYLFRDGPKGDGGVKGSEAYYTDRMASWDPEKARRALAKFYSWGTRPEGNPQKTCQEAAEIYFGKGVKCVGYAIGINVSSGYPYGIFYVTDIPKETVEDTGA